ncbi:MAG: amino acid decarboxylase [Clostridia bacterium]|nr:amino acid decarboxylase [Clostridia bacterium]
MKTPIVDFVKNYADAKTARFHMPGHKGKSFLGMEALDITEIGGADVLSCPHGILAESEENATSLFGTAHTFYSTEGSSLAIKAMLALVTTATPRGASRPRILAGRNAHKAFLYACALLDLQVTWLYPSPEERLCSCVITPKDLEAALATMEEPPAAVYLTSPDYLGQTSDIAGIAACCRAHGIPLLVDNAHGAYLKFLSPSRHPMDLGATMCCDSAHKTLPVLTGGAYLHLSKEADPSLVERARGMLALFASTSPSYLILQSLDACNRYLTNGYRERLAACLERVAALKEALGDKGIPQLSCEPLKLIPAPRAIGYTGEALAEHLRSAGVEAEFYDDTHLVLMITPENDAEDLRRLEEALFRLPRKEALPSPALPAILPHTAPLSIREAILSPSQAIPVALAEGRICATPTVSCPPAIPIVISGERITAADVELLAHYGQDTVDVIVEE